MKPPVVIVGAGAAGLSAAGILLDEGIPVVLLEATDRIGGRVRHMDGFAPWPIELGAEEVHGLDNCLRELVLRAGLDFITHESRNDMVRLDGKMVSLATEDPDMRRAFEFIAGLDRAEKPDWTAEQDLVFSHFPRRTRHYLDSRLGVEHGTTLDRLGLRGFKTYEKGWEARENNYTLSGPYLSLFGDMMEKARPHMKLNSPVAGMDWTVKNPKVHLNDGKILEASAVLVTASVAVLKAGDIVFNPPLPESKIHALSNIGMDAGMKIILRFRERFWSEEMYFLHTDGFLPQFWTPGKNRVPECHVLTAFLGGTRAEFLAGLSCDPIAFAVAELDEIFGGRIASRLFQAGHVADWGAEPYVKGLYSYPMATTTDAHRTALAAPLGKTIFFAGEATDLHGHTGTVHGAVESGRRAASEMVSARLFAGGR
jgi:monoamine oxidase